MCFRLPCDQVEYEYKAREFYMKEKKRQKENTCE